jgi:hypothetical protein
VNEQVKLILKPDLILEGPTGFDGHLDRHSHDVAVRRDNAHVTALIFEVQLDNVGWSPGG